MPGEVASLSWTDCGATARGVLDLGGSMRLHACARRGVELPAIALVTAGVLVFNGCAAVPAPVATVASTTTAVASAAPSDPDTVEPTSDSTPSTNERGNIPKLLGEEAQLVDGNGNLAVTFKVTKIEAGFKCNSGYADRSENGHYVAVWMEISTTKAVDFDSSDANVVPYFNPGDWHVIEGQGCRGARHQVQTRPLGPHPGLHGLRLGVEVLAAKRGPSLYKRIRRQPEESRQCSLMPGRGR